MTERKERPIAPAPQWTEMQYLHCILSELRQIKDILNEGTENRKAVALNLRAGALVPKQES